MHTGQSKVITVRIDHDALAVLEWEARYTGIPMRSTIRAILQERAEAVSAQYRNLHYTAPSDTESLEDSHGH
jgi:hypothetical protein